jgi:hypothetical protein
MLVFPVGVEHALDVAVQLFRGFRAAVTLGRDRNL